MKVPLYTTTRDLHLYLGLFISPFVVVFAVSVFFLNHPAPPEETPKLTPVHFEGVRIPPGVELARGKEQVELVRSILPQIGVAGEINYIRTLPQEKRLVFPVVTPGEETTVELDLANGSATTSKVTTGIPGALAFLHKMPGPHNVAIRGNWVAVRVWKWLADATVYLLLFISVTGVYLWTVLRAERRTGLVLLGAGAISLFGVIYALCV